jgi:hypothetical protein
MPKITRSIVLIQPDYVLGLAQRPLGAPVVPVNLDHTCFANLPNRKRNSAKPKNAFVAKQEK